MRISVAGQSNAEGLAIPLKAYLPGETIGGFHYGGSGLSRHPQSSTNYWFNPEKSEPLIAWKPDWVWWIQGESEALYGSTEEDYARDLRCLFAKMPQAKVLISPVACWDPCYKYLRPVLAAQYRIIDNQKFFLGPEYYDLDNDGMHLSGEGRIAFVERAVQWFNQHNA